MGESNRSMQGIPAMQYANTGTAAGMVPFISGVPMGQAMGQQVSAQNQPIAQIPVIASQPSTPLVQPLESPTPITPVWARSSTVIRDNNGQIIALRFVTKGGRAIETRPGDLNWNLQEVGLQ